MTKFTVETGAMADACTRAARVAPNKGIAFDKAQGIVLDVKPDRSCLYVKSTDLEVTYLQKVNLSTVEGSPCSWRVPSNLLSGILSGFPMGSGNEVAFTDEIETQGTIQIKAGRKKAQVRLIVDASFPPIRPFDPNGMAQVPDLAARLHQVSWATDPNEAMVLHGIHIDGTGLTACDRVSAATAPCVVPVDDPITVPLRTVAPLFKNVGAMGMRAADGRLQLMPDQDTQITSLILEQEYPNVGGIKRTTFGGSFNVAQEALIEAVNAMLVLCKSERYPALDVLVHADHLELLMDVPEVGKMEDAVPCSNGPTDPWDFRITPQRLMDAVSHSRKPVVTVNYGPDNKMPLNVKDDDSYDCWVMPLRRVEKTS